jgi:hypothetical protein
MAQSFVNAERLVGLDSLLIPIDDVASHALGDDADIHVAHTHLSDRALRSQKPIVWVAHGTPEVMFHSGYEQGLVNGKYGHGDPWMLAQFWLQHADAIVTFWPRHQAIWQSLLDKGRTVDCVPMGIETAFWEPQPSAGKFAGSPSVFTAENCYEIKWPLDLFLMWPWVLREVPDARLHAIYVPKDQHRWWFPLVNRNGSAFYSYISAMVFDPPELRNAFASVDFYLGLVRYGDFNRTCLEAKASGATVISWAGNPYADYWLPEGDQRAQADLLIKILRGEIQKRETTPVMDIAETITAMQAIYARLS